MEPSSAPETVDGRTWAGAARQLAATAALLGALGLVAVGVSGVVAWGMDVAFGPRFVAGDASAVAYTSARCAEFREYTNVAGSCEAAAARHHTDEVETYRFAAGVAGALALVGWYVARRYSGWLHRFVPPRVLVDGGGAAAFTAAGLLLAAQATSSLDGHSLAGLGQWVSAAVVALVFAGFLSIRLFIDVQRAPLA